MKTNTPQFEFRFPEAEAFCLVKQTGTDGARISTILETTGSVMILLANVF